MLKAPEGHIATWSISSCEVANSGVTHGFALGLYTLGKVRTQTPEWVHLAGSHTIVTSPLLYSFVVIVIHFKFFVKIVDRKLVIVDVR